MTRINTDPESILRNVSHRGTENTEKSKEKRSNRILCVLRVSVRDRFGNPKIPLALRRGGLTPIMAIMTKVATSSTASADVEIYLTADAFFRASLPTALTFDDVS